MDRKPLQTWVHPSHRVVLLGDACHPMLARLFSFLLVCAVLTLVLVYFPQPYRAQGAAMAVEDAAILGHLFARVSSQAHVGPLLRAYERLRFPRTANTQASSRLNQHIFHLPDGPAQAARDAGMRAAMDEPPATIDPEAYCAWEARQARPLAATVRQLSATLQLQPAVTS